MGIVTVPIGADVSVAAQVGVVPEGNDFATEVMRDPWDMSEFSDISQWLNRTGPENYLLDIQVENGLFSARSASGGSYFFILYGGYPPGVRIGNIGLLHPISSNEYSCFYLAMRAETPSSPAYYQLSWGSDESLPPTAYGQAFNTELENGIWKLYFIPLSTWPWQDQAHWDDEPMWRSLRMTPSLTDNTTFTVDWIRLTDCQSVQYNLTGLPTSGYFSLWVGTGSPERQILVEENAQSSDTGTYDWDVQGLAPGEYTYYVLPPGMRPGEQTPIQQDSFVINAAPIVKFVRPSAQSGEDHPTSAGNPWDMSDVNDIYGVECVSNWYFEEGSLLFDTPPPPMLPPGCVGVGANEADPRIFLKSNETDIQYRRFLSFRLFQSGDWSLPEKGMIGRWIWTLDTPTGDSCIFTSRDIALDVGWATYEIDFHDDWNGIPNEVLTIRGTCPLLHWKQQQGNIVGFRFDPNENITGSTFHQELDWVRLTRIDRSVIGKPFPIRISLNKQAVGVDFNFYYTTDPVGNPTQSIALPFDSSSPPLTGPYFLYLPLVHRDSHPDPNGFTFLWDTSSVLPGVYYICAAIDDGYNTATYCSETPLEIINP